MTLEGHDDLTAILMRRERARALEHRACRVLRSRVLAGFLQQKGHLRMAASSTSRPVGLAIDQKSPNRGRNSISIHCRLC
jgi:hypothetical protein